MSMRHYVALAYLRDVEHAPQQLMCEIFGVDANNMVLLLNALEAAGYVARIRDPADRRRHLVELTDAGRAALERAEIAQGAIETRSSRAQRSRARDPARAPRSRARRAALATHSPSVHPPAALSPKPALGTSGILIG